MKEGDVIPFGAYEIRVIETPGHTLGHVSYYIPAAKVAFVADTLFALGCGRVIEGTFPMMWNSLEKLMALPDDTAVYFGHEYTQANARFALTIEPANSDLIIRAREVDALRAAGKATLPTTIGPREAHQSVPPGRRAGGARSPRHAGCESRRGLRRDPDPQGQFQVSRAAFPARMAAGTEVLRPAALRPMIPGNFALT